MAEEFPEEKLALEVPLLQLGRKESNCLIENL